MAVRAHLPTVAALLLPWVVTGAVFAGDTVPGGLSPKPMAPVGGDPQAELPAAPPAKKVQTVPVAPAAAPKASTFDDTTKPVDPKAGVFDDTTKPVDPKAGGFDDSIKPVDPKASTFDDTIKPVDPKAGTFDDTTKPVDPKAAPKP